MDNTQWKVVPVEPTDGMVQAAHQIDLSYMPGQEGADRAAIYRAMLAAAPEMIADVTPPPTSRDRWFYQQGWIAHEREAAPQPPSASGEGEANIAELTELVLTPDAYGGHYFNHVTGCTECYDCDGQATGDDDIQHKPDCPSITDEARHRRRLALAYAIQAAPSPGIDAAEPVAWLTSDGKMLVFADKISKGRAQHSGMTPLYAAPPAAQPSADNAQFPFYELRFIMRVLGHKGSAPQEDWATAYGMARKVFERWSKDGKAAAEWLAEAEKLVDAYAKEFAQGGPTYARDINRAALLAHLRTKPSTEQWCDTMDRPKSKCGCPDCGPSLIDLGPGLHNTPGKP